MMELNYSCWQDGGWYVGHFDAYPEYHIQGRTVEEFEEMLKSLYEVIKARNFSRGNLQIA
jgi:predicted RNase H-like HicB family nuclease